MAGFGHEPTFMQSLLNGGIATKRGRSSQPARNDCTFWDLAEQSGVTRIDRPQEAACLLDDVPRLPCDLPDVPVRIAEAGGPHTPGTIDRTVQQGDAA